ncbi:MAG TPA: hypothetical protein VJP02_17855 [Candidatus Sulfotelmatobacter sp.]|nr:hypothetical protein [Candidatus Sulfotelmatobacter sp.]
MRGFMSNDHTIKSVDVAIRINREAFLRQETASHTTVDEIFEEEKSGDAEFLRLVDIYDPSSLVGVATHAAYAETHRYLNGAAQDDVIEQAVTATLEEWVECPHHFVQHTCLVCTPKDAAGRNRTAAPRTQIPFTAHAYEKGKPVSGLVRLAQRNASRIRKLQVPESLTCWDGDSSKDPRFSDKGHGARLIEAAAPFGRKESDYDWGTHWKTYHATSVWKSCLRVGYPEGYGSDGEPTWAPPIPRVWVPPTFEVIQGVLSAA